MKTFTVAVIAVIGLLACFSSAASPGYNAGLNQGVISSGKVTPFITMASNLTAQERARAIAEKYDVGGAAEKIRNAVPRFGYSKDIDASTDYAIGVAIGAVVGLVFAVLTLLTCFLFLICRCCCNCCGGRKPKPEGYSTAKRWVPYFILLFFLAFCLAFSGVGYFANVELSNGFQGDSSQNQTSTNGGGLTGAVLDIIDDGLNLVSVVRVPLQGVQDITPGIVTTIQGKLNGTLVLSDGTNGLTSRVDTLSSGITGLTVNVTGVGVADNIVYVCDFCTDTANKLNDINQEIRDKAGPAFDDLDDTVTKVNGELIDATDSILDQIGSAVTTLNDLESDGNDNRGDAKDALEEAKDGDDLRKLFVFGILALPAVTLVFVTLGGCCRRGAPFTFSYLTAYMFLFIFWLLFAVHLPLALVLGDGCVYVTERESNLTAEFSADQKETALVLEACLLNTSMVDALNLTDDLDFRSQIVFPTVDIASAFDFGQLDSFSGDVANLTLATFGYNATAMDALFVSLNNITSKGTPPRFYGRTNITTTDPNKVLYTPPEDDIVENLRDNILTLLDAEAELNTTLAAIKTNTTVVTDYSSELEANITQIDVQIAGIKDDVEPLFGKVDDFTNAAFCGNIGDGYRSAKKIICEDMVTSISLLAFVFFMLALGYIPIVIISTVLSKRCKRQATGVESVEEEAAWDGNPEHANDHTNDDDGEVNDTFKPSNGQNNNLNRW